MHICRPRKFCQLLCVSLLTLKKRAPSSGSAMGTASLLPGRGPTALHLHINQNMIWGEYHRKRAIISILLACGCWLNIYAGLVALCTFQGIRTSFAKKPSIMVIFRGGWGWGVWVRSAPVPPSPGSTHGSAGFFIRQSFWNYTVFPGSAGKGITQFILIFPAKIGCLYSSEYMYVGNLKHQFLCLNAMIFVQNCVVVHFEFTWVKVKTF